MDASDVGRPDRGIATLVLSILLGLALIVCLALIGLTLGSQAADRAARSELRRELVSKAVQFACQEIELLKAGEREAARQSFRDLNKNLRLLKLKRTPELVQAARESRDRKLARYARKPCPVPF